MIWVVNNIPVRLAKVAFCGNHWWHLSSKILVTLLCSSQSQSLLIRRVVSVSVFLPFGVYFALTKMTKITFQLERFYHFKIRKVRYWLQPISYRSLLIGDVCDHHTFGEKSEGRILVWKSSADLYFPVQSVMHDQEKSFLGCVECEMRKMRNFLRLLYASGFWWLGKNLPV